MQHGSFIPGNMGNVGIALSRGPPPPATLIPAGRGRGASRTTPVCPLPPSYTCPLTLLVLAQITCSQAGFCPSR